MKIAVIGSGIAGMGAAWLLRQQHELTLFEKDARYGGHANTVTAHTPQGPVAVDTGFMVYNEPNYPNLCGLFRALGVQGRDTDMSFAVSAAGGDYEYAGDNLASLFAQRSNLFSARHYRMLGQILRFNRLAARALRSAGDETVSLGEFLSQHRFEGDFSERYLLPMTAAIWSCPGRTMRQFPALSLFRFLDNHGLISLNRRPQWKTPQGGSGQYVRRLTAQLGDARCNASVVEVRRVSDGVSVRCSDGSEGHFDAVIMAAHADQTLAMLADPHPAERELLSAFTYQNNQAYLHADTRLMPLRRRAWSSWNYLTDNADDTADAQAVSVTYWMNRLQHLPMANPLLVSLNPLCPPASDSIYWQAQYEHPVFDAAALQAQTRLAEIQGQDRIWYCGSYFRYGFHEDALASAVKVARALGATIPWQEGGTAENNTRPDSAPQALTGAAL
ncbi:FAD-dependent oxidoreductase [Granulosicoccaceae sp. 1_MG-2023]|nr:FAD-dependent oxidoreductase [Granulosicoccaceae sp. 1_MG-2023]